jgi:hypothetical protein
MAEWEAEDCRSGEGNEASGREVVGVAGDMTARAGRRPCTGRSDEASTAASRGAALAFPSWPLGRSFWLSTPWRGASLPPSADGRRDAYARLRVEATVP